jgi:hypothetical protein
LLMAAVASVIRVVTVGSAVTAGAACRCIIAPTAWLPAVACRCSTCASSGEGATGAGPAGARPRAVRVALLAAARERSASAPTSAWVLPNVYWRPARP